MDKKKPEGRIFLTSMHHSDLTWQFSYEEYDEIREEQLNIVMDFFEKHKEYGFVIDQAYVLQNYLQRNPEKFGQIQKQIDEGRGDLELIGGYSIPDMNLISGESFLRNCMLGQQYYQKTFNYIPECASLMDSFGTPSQTPQMLALLGYKYLAPGRMPNAPEELDTDSPFVWQGPAGSSVTVVPQATGVDKTAYITNVPIMLDEDERFEKTLTDLQNTEGNVLAYYMTEIQMLDERFFRHLERVNANPDAKRKVTFGRLADYCKTLDKATLPVYMGEFNPIFTGCYTTRIGVKQQIRAAENALFRAELVGALTNREQNFTKAWAQLCLGEFHDAACGCHHDRCNADVHEKLGFVLDCAEKSCAETLGTGDALAVINPSVCEEEQLVETSQDALPADVPVQRDGDRYFFTCRLPALGVKTFETGSADQAVQTQKCGVQNYYGETECFTFDFSSPMPKIKSRRHACSVFGQENFGEILFRHESRTMWEEVIREVPYGAEYQDEEVCSVEEGPLFIKVTTKGAVRPGHRPISGNSGDYWPGFKALSFQKEYIFPRHMPYFRLRVTLNFGPMLFEMTHFTDLCNWFMDAEPEEVVAMETGMLNLAIIIKYKIGELATLNMCANGTFGYPKELYEIMGNGGIVVVDHMCEIRTAGIAGAPAVKKYDFIKDRHPGVGVQGGIEGFREKKAAALKEAVWANDPMLQFTAEPNKGHSVALENFIDQINGLRGEVCGVDDAVSASQIAFAAIKSAREKRFVRVDEI